MLTIKKLRKEFEGQEVIHGLDLEVEAGEIVSLIGPNGSGKTTTVKIVAGLLQPTSGSVMVDGHSVVSNPVAAKACLGYIPDDPSIWPGVTGEEFLHFTGALYGMDQEQRRQRIAELLPVFKLEGLAGGVFSEYSRGNRQKFSIIAALLHNPKLLLIDEPIVGLDPTSIDTAMRLFLEVAQKGTAILLIAHTLPVVAELSDRIGVIQYGHLKGLGTLPELRQQAGLAAGAGIEKVYHGLVKE